MSDELRQRTIKTLEWMIKDMDYINQLNDKDYDSPEMAEAKRVLFELKQEEKE